MNWGAIAAVAELLGAVGVIASLVYLAGQVRSSGNQARQAAVQSVVNKMNVVWADLSTEGTADIWVRGSKGFSNLESETEGVRFSAFMLSVFSPWQELHHYRLQGLVDDWTWESVSATCCGIMGSPGFAEWWERRGSWFSAQFQQHIAETQKTIAPYQRHDTRAGLHQRMAD